MGEDDDRPTGAALQGGLEPGQLLLVDEHLVHAESVAAEAHCAHPDAQCVAQFRCPVVPLPEDLQQTRTRMPTQHAVISTSSARTRRHAPAQSQHGRQEGEGDDRGAIAKLAASPPHITPKNPSPPAARPPGWPHRCRNPRPPGRGCPSPTPAARQSPPGSAPQTPATLCTAVHMIT